MKIVSGEQIQPKNSYFFLYLMKLFYPTKMDHFQIQYLLQKISYSKEYVAKMA